ncbi:MAG: 3D domain-containing protein [Kiritimatiellae bacterium]|nr:3D domain-containing protein [Kiritimatiellia bacterium]
MIQSRSCEFAIAFGLLFVGLIITLQQMKNLSKIILLILVVTAVGCSGTRPKNGAKPIVRELLTTGYCKCGECCGWKRNWYGRAVYSYGPNKGKKKVVGQTASGTIARPGTIAADTKLYPFGTIIYIEGYGYGRVEDRGGAINGQHIDLYFRSHKQALEWGRRTVKARIWKP